MVQEDCLRLDLPVRNESRTGITNVVWTAGVVRGDLRGLYSLPLESGRRQTSKEIQELIFRMVGQLSFWQGQVYLCWISSGARRRSRGRAQNRHWIGTDVGKKQVSLSQAWYSSFP